MNNYFCDLMYEKEGHFDQDFENFNNWCDGYLTHIQRESVNLQNDISNAKECLKLKGHKVIGSAYYIPLFIASILCHNWDYTLIIHFFPENRPYLYKYIIKVFIKKCNRIVVFDKAVKSYLIERTRTKYEDKICVMHTREVKKLPTVQRDNQNQKIQILVIGNLNSSKILKPLLESIKRNKYENIEFKFVCHGINNRLIEDGFDLKKDVEKNSVIFEDRFPDLNEYKRLLNSADYLYLAYTKEYGIRASGALLDSLSQGTPVIVNDNATLVGFVESYKCGFSYSTTQDLFKILSDIDNGKTIKPTFTDNLYIDFSEERNRKNAKENLLGE